MFFNKLKDLRAEKGVTQAKVVADIKKDYGVTVPVQSYSTYENRIEPPYSVLCALAKYFGVTTDYLLGLVDNPSRNIDDVAATEIYGLDENALKILRIMKSIPALNYLPQINALFAADVKFRNLLKAMRDYQAEMDTTARCLRESDIENRPELAKYKDMTTDAALDLLAVDQPAITAIAESFAKSSEAEEASERRMIYLFKAQQLLLSIIEGSVKQSD